jgi:hypothetical protein
MPVIFRFGPFTFRIHSNENRMAHEPTHVHVDSPDGSAVFWLMPVSLRGAWGYTPRQVALIRRIVSANRDLLLRRWDEFFDEDHSA